MADTSTIAGLEIASIPVMTDIVDITQTDDLWRPYRTDLDTNMFTAMRDKLKASYPEPDGICESVFWPGCSLASYSPQLTNKIFSWLRDRNLADAITTMCCGNILKFAASPRDYELYQKRVVDFAQIHGIKRVVTACPNCFYALRQLYCAIEVVNISELLLEHGMRLTAAKLGQSSVAIHDSCPDRREGIIASSVRALCAGLEKRELEHCREHSRCCGLGKMLSVSAPEASENMRNERLREFTNSGADVLIGYCYSCVQALQPYKSGNKSREWRCLHYLEVLFDEYINWENLFGVNDDSYT